LGTRYIFNNKDSSVVKILVKYSSGEYGNGENEFLLVNNHLIYQRDYTVDWLALESPADSNDYKLTEVVSYFNPDSTGTRGSKSLSLPSLDITGQNSEQLRNKLADKELLTKVDYLVFVDELKKALALELQKDE
jgi:hypothetical protein